MEPKNGFFHGGTQHNGQEKRRVCSSITTQIFNLILFFLCHEKKTDELIIIFNKQKNPSTK
jgi:hypothetical protein